MGRFDYSELAHDYDESRYKGRKNSYINLVHKNCLTSLLPKDKTGKILDVGCGTGRGVLFLAEQGYHKVAGLDYTMKMLKVCSNKLADIKEVSLIRGDAGRLPFPDNSIDCIISLNFLHLFNNKEQKKFIDEMARVLKPHGSLICEFDNYYRGIIAGKQTLKNNPTLNLNKYSDFKYLFSNPLKIQKIRGSSLPYIWRIFQYITNIAVYIEKLSYVFPFLLIAPRFLIRAVKC